MKHIALAALLACTLAPAPALPARVEPPAGAYARLIRTHAPALVTLKFVLEAPAEFGAGEQEMEASGVMVEKDGLVLAANSQFGGMIAMMGGPTPAIKNIRVLIGDDTKGVEATLTARDRELDLAWIRIATPDEAGYAHLDLEASADAGVGDRIHMVSRMGKFFDRAPLVTEAAVGGVTAKPRRLLVPNGFLLQFGMPVFGESGRLVGITVIQSPSEEDQDDSSSGMMGETDSLRGLILPASEVLAATARAKETAAAPTPTPTPTPPPAP
ncbi:MAG: trypsin-like peptidase domain-containing protein [Phycisphaerae bacterium]|nr:trypsin-like peptidase domain-containing protein [Phycisphaerae bacterium]